ncbi:MAG: hypothetical protein AUH81_00980 [Candidatus Rokubacteria bacterium 13_1_40CM_4_69_5]|nr:MAG: hypothetical protein AUH81_00980 [Candidatus Rokubacteria bacterium 13_1_40CM_4_69_5]OLE37617.1 MAG: hypothetical protein AUG00_07700 [Candidatus Rokubacteria bacterium 13_1_20CM_2_70_7]
MPMPMTETSSAVRPSLRLSMTAECTAVAVAGTLAGMGEGTVAALVQYALPGIIVVSALGVYLDGKVPPRALNPEVMA